MVKCEKNNNKKRKGVGCKRGDSRDGEAVVGGFFL
jgi:hypothetical protein